MTHIQIDPIRELLKAGLIVGLDPREMTLIALEELSASLPVSGEPGKPR